MRFNTVRAIALASVFRPPPPRLRCSLLDLPWHVQPPDSFADLAGQLLPAVVNISSASSVQARADRGGQDNPGLTPGSPFEQFFKDFLDRQHRGENVQPNRPGQGGGVPSRPEGAGPRSVSVGSGFIIDPDGYIVHQQPRHRRR